MRRICRLREPTVILSCFILLAASVPVAAAHRGSAEAPSQPVQAAGDSTSDYPFRNPDLGDEERISNLIGRMTLAEKIGSLSRRVAVPRLGVEGSPHIEGYHGVAQGGPSNWGHRNPTATTQFPQAYGLGSTWDPELIRRVAAQQAHEARFLQLCVGLAYVRGRDRAVVWCELRFGGPVLAGGLLEIGGERGRGLENRAVGADLGLDIDRLAASQREEGFPVHQPVDVEPHTGAEVVLHSGISCEIGHGC